MNKNYGWAIVEADLTQIAKITKNEDYILSYSYSQDSVLLIYCEIKPPTISLGIPAKYIPVKRSELPTIKAEDL